MFNMNFFQWLDSNQGPLESEATALPNEPPPLPLFAFVNVVIKFTACENGNNNEASVGQYWQKTILYQKSR